MDMSIIVPCHNLEKFITPLLVSLDLQVIQHYEVELIFVCDDCTDKTANIIDTYPGRDSSYKDIKVVKCKVNSCGLARNIGMDIATGDIIGFIDGDDWLLNIYCIPKIITTFQLTNASIIRFDYKASPYFVMKGYYSMVGQYAFKRDILRGIKFASIQPNEDVYFMKEVLNKTNRKVYYLNEILYYYNFAREDSNMFNYLKEKGLLPDEMLGTGSSS